MASAVLSATTDASFIPTIISQEALGRFASYMNISRTVSRDFDWATAQFGDTIQVAKRGAVVANAKSPGNQVVPQNPSATNVQVKLNQHYEATFIIDDVDKVLVNQDVQAGYGEDGAIALAEQVESTLLGLWSSVTSVIDLITTNATTIDTSLLNLRKYFVNQKVPRVEKKFVQVDPSVVNTLLGQDKYSRYDATGQLGKMVVDNPSDPFLQIYGLNLFESQLIATTGSPVAYHNVAYSKNAFILASRSLPSVPNGFGAVSAVVNDDDIGMGLRGTMSYDPKLQGFQLTLDILFGASVLDQRRVTLFESF
jgi:hypothetical protein